MSPRKKRSTGTEEQVDPRMQETCVVWYRGAKVIEINTTNYSDICLFKRRGWEPVKGKEGEAAKPYLIFRIPKKALTIRSKSAVGKKRKKKT